MGKSNFAEQIRNKETYLGIEFGSTRIKAVLTGADHTPIASGSYDWENQYEDGIWTYHLDMIWRGLKECYRSLREEVGSRYGVDCFHIELILIFQIHYHIRNQLFQKMVQNTDIERMISLTLLSHFVVCFLYHTSLPTSLFIKSHRKQGSKRPAHRPGKPDSHSAPELCKNKCQHYSQQQICKSADHERFHGSAAS